LRSKGGDEVEVVAWIIFEVALIAFFVAGYVLYRRARARDPNRKP